MSSAADVAEMKTLCEQIADMQASSNSWKDRVTAVARALSVTWSRAKDFYYGDARRVDGFEKDRARAIIAEIEAENARRKEAEHIEWLRTTYEQLAEDDEGVDSRTVVRLGHLLRKLGALDSALEISASSQE